MATSQFTSISEQFNQDGYYLAKGVFSPKEIVELEADFDQIVAQLMASGEQINARWGGAEVEKLGGQDSIVIHTHNVQQYSAVWLRALMQDKFLEQARAILGDNVILHHTKLFQKPGEKGAPFPMHQDWSYFPTEKDTMMAGIIHVSNATNEMGCLRVYPGSHKLGRMDNSYGQSAESILLEKYPIENATILEAELGDVLFFHYFTIHGSMPNSSDQTRKTVLVQMYAGDDQVEVGNPHPDEKLVLSGWNHRATRSSVNS